MPYRLIRLPEVCDRTGLKRSAIYKRIKDGSFPEPVSIGVRATAWVESEVNTWVEARIKDGYAKRVPPCVARAA